MAKRPSPNTGFRWPTFTKKELTALKKRLAVSQGHVVKQDDLVAVLIQRASATLTAQRDLDALGAEVRAQRIKAEKAGF